MSMSSILWKRWWWMLFITCILHPSIHKENFMQVKAIFSCSTMDESRQDSSLQNHISHRFYPRQSDHQVDTKRNLFYRHNNASRHTVDPQELVLVSMLSREFSLLQCKIFQCFIALWCLIRVCLRLIVIVNIHYKFVFIPDQIEIIIILLLVCPNAHCMMTLNHPSVRIYSIFIDGDFASYYVCVHVVTNLPQYLYKCYPCFQRQQRHRKTHLLSPFIHTSPSHSNKKTEFMSTWC